MAKLNNKILRTFAISMTQKNIVITGGNIGIGLETAKGLYADGHYIIFGSRN